MSVLFRIEDHVARVTLNRPEAMNAVDRATEAELQRQHIEDFDSGGEGVCQRAVEIEQHIAWTIL